ncbi:AraC family transcriptional regulator, partial [Burkholderia multivorans]
NVLFSCEPECQVSVTSIRVDTDFALDQFFWQHSAVLHDRLDAPGFAEKIYSEPAQILRLGRDRAGMVVPWID